MGAATAAFIFKVVALLYTAAFSAVAATWCVVRSDASEQAMQRSLDYACGAGADCAPLQSSGLCFLPNTLQAHASYAINSYYQRRGNAPDSCSFAGAAAIATTDPSYGSCVYPSSPRNAGGTMPTPGGATTASTTPTLTEPPPPPGTSLPISGGGGGLNPGLGTIVPDSPVSNVSPNVSEKSIFITFVIHFLLLFLCIFLTM
ncbi:Carbohydrate-binding X8 domain superfamily protein [Perilla frutescens var. hirtella]|nr:Carbohydrate-binding X8 domain superfamily protein [Perilla frutescens var. hirtella]